MRETMVLVKSRTRAHAHTKNVGVYSCHSHHRIRPTQNTAHVKLKCVDGAVENGEWYFDASHLKCGIVCAPRSLDTNGSSIAS